MANKVTKGKIRKSKTQPLTKSKTLEELCNDEQLTVIRGLAAKGCAFIVLGSEHTPTKTFQIGLMEEMHLPTSNGVAIYDTYYQYKFNFSRPVVTISLNDNSNTCTSLVDNIKILDRYRSRTVYTYHYEEALKK